MLVECNRTRDTLPGVPGEALLYICALVEGRKRGASKQRAGFVLALSVTPSAKSQQMGLLGELIAIIMRATDEDGGRQSCSTSGAIVLGRKPKDFNTFASQQGRAQR